jgi:hypothetical protein
MGAKIDLTGQRFGMLTVIGKGSLTSKKEQKWICQCDCGAVKENRGSHLKRGEALSCGCRRRKIRNDLTGKRFSKLTVIKHLGKLNDQGHYYECLCDCGNTKTVFGGHLTSEHVKSCGCFYKRDLTGLVFGKLTVVEKAPNRPDGLPAWRCLCECGNEKDIRQQSLESGDTQSCGCLCTGAIKHGMCYTKVYKAWSSMKHRCFNPDSKHYHNYGGRGIKVCDRWLESFENFYEDMGEPPSAKHSLERLDVNGNYEPNNCTWATVLEQARNRRDNIRIEYGGELLVLSEVYKRLDYIHPTVILPVFSDRIYKKWSIEKASKTPYSGKRCV